MQDDVRSTNAELIAAGVLEVVGFHCTECGRNLNYWNGSHRHDYVDGKSLSLDFNGTACGDGGVEELVRLKDVKEKL